MSRIPPEVTQDVCQRCTHCMLECLRMDYKCINLAVPY